MIDIGICDLQGEKENEKNNTFVLRDWHSSAMMEWIVIVMVKL
jgi:hypothetical protein